MKSTKVSLAPIFDEKTFTVICNYSHEIDVPSKLRTIALRSGFTPKQHLHVTIIGSETGDTIVRSARSQAQRDQFYKQILELLNRFDWTIEHQRKYYLIEKVVPEYKDEKGKPEYRKSIIEMINIPSLNLFYEKLNNKLNQNFPTPLAHITLFTTSTVPTKLQRGIGIYSKNHFASLKPTILKP